MSYPYRRLIKPRLGTPIYKGHPLTRGLVACWLMNEGAGNKVFDFSGYNGSKATLNGNAAWVAGNKGWSIDFSSSGADYIKINPTLGFGTSGTFVWSVLLDSIVDDGSHTSIDDSSSAACLHIVNNLSNTVRAMHYNTAGALVIDLSTAVFTNKWMTIAYAWSPSAGKLYLDGVLKAQDTSITGTLRIPSEIWIGSEHGVTNLGLDGRISYFYGYNRVLSPEEIGRLHTQPFTMFERPSINLFYTNMPETLEFTGTLDPDATGDFVEAGEYNGEPYCYNAIGGFFNWYDSVYSCWAVTHNLGNYFGTGYWLTYGQEHNYRLSDSYIPGGDAYGIGDMHIKTVSQTVLDYERSCRGVNRGIFAGVA